jgi:uncharacterized protein YcnI
MKRLVVFVCALLLIAAPAWAHVEVSPEEAPRGSAATLTFSVPNEEDTAATVKIELIIPSQLPIATITPGDAPAGWTAAVGTDRVTWSGGKLTGEQEKDFAIHVSALPSGSVDELVFKALQTYDNGDVVRWIDETPPGGAEPEHPAPVLKLTGPVNPSVTTTPKSTSNTLKHPDKTNSTGIVLVIVAAVVVIGLLIAFALRGRRRTP